MEEIGGKVGALLTSADRASTLVLVSTYNMGKEKILHECLRRSGTEQLLYVVPKKKVMLQCVKDGAENEQASSGETAAEGVDGSKGGDGAPPPSTLMSLVDSVTTVGHESNFHCVRMEVAGKMQPYFQPDYRSVCTVRVQASEPSFASLRAGSCRIDDLRSSSLLAIAQLVSLNFPFPFSFFLFFLFFSRPSASPENVLTTPRRMRSRAVLSTTRSSPSFRLGELSGRERDRRH